MSAHDYLYENIAETFRKQIVTGQIRSGEKLPPVRAVAATWSCTIGSVQKAYQILSDEGLVSSRPGLGTVVEYGRKNDLSIPVRRAKLLRHSEEFLQEMMSAGYAPDEVETAIREERDRLRVMDAGMVGAKENVLRFQGSHDLAFTWIASHFKEIAPGWSVELNFSGSLRGLMALENNQADLAGSHLWDEETNTYNIPFIQKILPGKKVFVVTLCTRDIGLFVAPGNPKGIHSIEDIPHNSVRFINRQDGAGIRVWLDTQLSKAKILPTQINGYATEVGTHSDVALAIAEDRADVGIGIEAAARQYGLEFMPLHTEQYDLVLLANIIDQPAISKFITWLDSPSAKSVISNIPGYHSDITGKKQIVQ